MTLERPPLEQRRERSSTRPTDPRKPALDTKRIRSGASAVGECTDRQPSLGTVNDPAEPVNEQGRLALLLLLFGSKHSVRALVDRKPSV
jgi:hypothetical protein